MDLAGKKLVYLGGFGGIGQKCVRAFLNKQLKAVAIFDLKSNESLLQELQMQYPQTEIFFQQADITQKAEIAAAYEATFMRIGHFDVVVNGFGLMNDRLIDLTIAIDLLGVIHSTLIAMDYMNKSGTKCGQGGCIVNISSVAGLQPTSMFPVYSAAKTGVTTFTRALANPVYYAHAGVSFVTICPGFTDTALLQNVADKGLFDFETPFPKMFEKVKRQSAEICAENFVKVVEQANNGSAWILEDGEYKEVDFPTLWRPVLQN